MPSNEIQSIVDGLKGIRDAMDVQHEKCVENELIWLGLGFKNLMNIIDEHIKLFNQELKHI